MTAVMIMGDYEGLSDNRLLELSREGDDGAVEFLMYKYKDLAKRRAKAMYLLGADNEDVLQEAMIGLYKAVRDYRADRDAAFITFADLCIQRQIYTAIRQANTKKNRPLNESVSIDSCSEYGVPGPEEYIIGQVNAADIEECLEKRLSELECIIWKAYINGDSIKKIAEATGKNNKAVDNALTRIKKKLIEVLKSFS